MKEVVARRAEPGAKEPKVRRLVRDFLASDNEDLQTVQCVRAEYAAAAEGRRWLPVQPDWALFDDVIELDFELLDGADGFHAFSGRWAV